MSATSGQRSKNLLMTRLSSFNDYGSLIAGQSKKFMLDLRRTRWGPSGPPSAAIRGSKRSSLHWRQN